MRVVIAPDCFGDSLTAPDAARAIAAGWRARRPADTLVVAPQSDGGPGFVDVLLAVTPGLRPRHSRVGGPLEAPVDALWCYQPDTAIAYLECAQACGLSQLGGPPTPRTALAAHSRGVGDLIGEAVQDGARTVVVGLGGSACTDGGRGMVDALGGLAEARRRLAGITLVAATDVEHPMLGPRGAAAVFGPQKGADQATVELLEQRLTGWADELEAAPVGGQAGRAVREVPGAGAAGGLGAALLALGATRRSGADVIAEHTGLAQTIAGADLILTGEGRLDDQSLHGKVVGTLARRGAAAGVPVLVLAGQIALQSDARRAAGITEAYAVADYAGSVRLAIDDAAAQLEGLAARTAAGLTTD